MQFFNINKLVEGSNVRIQNYSSLRKLVFELHSNEFEYTVVVSNQPRFGEERWPEARKTLILKTLYIKLFLKKLIQKYIFFKL